MESPNLLEYIEALKKQKEVPQINPEDPRLTLLDEALEGDEDEFFYRPSLHLYKEMEQKTSKQGEAWKNIKEALREFLDKGMRPQQGIGSWPLPETGLERKEEGKTPRPARAEVCIEIALFEKKIDLALSIYKAETKSLQTHLG